MYQAKRPSLIFGNLIANTSSGNMSLLCVCDKNGEIRWIKPDEVTVISVDGHTL